MKRFILALTMAASLIGGTLFTGEAQARPRGYYYGTRYYAPRYYGGYNYYRPNYYRAYRPYYYGSPYYYGRPNYYGNPYYYGGRGYISGPRLYIGW